MLLFFNDAYSQITYLRVSLKRWHDLDFFYHLPKVGNQTHVSSVSPLRGYFFRTNLAITATVTVDL